MTEKIVFETDWLGSNPVYYNERTKQASAALTDVIDTSAIALHPEGFANYLEFGYSVFGQTPLYDIKYLPHSSRLEVIPGISLSITRTPDVAEQYIDRNTTEKQALENIEHAILHCENSFPGDIILPLSGGFDSRLLNYFIKDKTRVRTFTYGTSESQSQSFEVVNAKKLAGSYNESWQQVPLNQFFSYIPAWETIYGITTHAHGMYQMEFYDYIRQRTAPHSGVLSGLIGDIWAGTLTVPNITTAEELGLLGYTHGLHANKHQSLLPSDRDLQENYFSEKKSLLQNPRWRVVEAMRFKMILLSYLITIPKHYGFMAGAPYIIPEVALSMLTLPAERRANRQWQRDFFASKNILNLEQHWFKDRKNTLNLKALRTQILEPLDVAILSEYLQPAYLEWVNRTIESAPQSLRLKKLLATPASLCYFFPGLHSLPGRLGIDPYTLKNEESRALNAYLTLHPIQTILKMRK